MGRDTPKKKISKLGITLISLSALLVASLSVFLGVTLSGFHGKDGIDGKDANISINDNGELIVNNSETGIFANKDDYHVTLKTEGEEYGRVVGGGKFSKGETVTVQAIPTIDGCFKGWKNSSGDILSFDLKYSFIAQTGNLELTGVFEKSLIELYFKIDDTSFSYFNNFALEINNQEQEMVKKSSKYGGSYYELENPSIVNYAETVKFSLKNLDDLDYDYNCYLTECDESYYSGNSGNKTRYNITDTMQYSFNIDENRKYYFVFSIEINIIIGLIPSINVSVNNDEYGKYTKTEVNYLGDLAKLNATANDSGTQDYIYEFKGWYIDDILVEENNSYSFCVEEYEYNIEARFIKKYALKIFISIYDYVTGLENSDPSEYIVSYKKIDVYSNNNKGETSSVSFYGNYNGSTPDLSTKICGYFEIGETIYLSSNLENSHESYYVIDNDTKEKEYCEKFVFTRWFIKNGSEYTSFSTFSSGTIMFNEGMDVANTDIKIELFVRHTDDRLGE